MMSVIGWQEVHPLLREFAGGGSSLPDIRRFFRPVLLGERAEFANSLAAGLSKVMFTLEDDVLGEERLRLFAERLSALGPHPPRDDVLVELSVIAVAGDRFCDVVAGFERGMITRTSLLNAISSSRFGPATKGWLKTADPQALRLFCTLMKGNDFAQLSRVLFS